MLDVSTVGTWFTWGIAILWFVGLILYLPQRVSIKIDKCYLESRREVNTIIVKRLIKARHKDYMMEFHLHLSEGRYLQSMARGHYPDSIDSTFVKFIATFTVPTEALGKSDNAYLSASLSNREWKSKEFKFY